MSPSGDKVRNIGNHGAGCGSRAEKGKSIALNSHLIAFIWIYSGYLWILLIVLYEKSLIWLWTEVPIQGIGCHIFPLLSLTPVDMGHTSSKQGCLSSSVYEYRRFPSGRWRGGSAWWLLAIPLSDPLLACSRLWHAMLTGDFKFYKHPKLNSNLHSNDLLPSQFKLKLSKTMQSSLQVQPTQQVTSNQ